MNHANFLENLQKNWCAILEEYRAYQGRKPAMPNWDGNGYGEVTGWNGLPLWWGGKPIKRLQRAFPLTSSLLSEGPSHLNTGFTITQARCHVPVHNHKNLGEYIFLHLPLYIPKGDVYYVVDGKSFQWSEGQLFAFDCRQDHESYNHSSEERIILIADFEKKEWGSHLEPFMPLTPLNYEPI